MSIEDIKIFQTKLMNLIIVSILFSLIIIFGLNFLIKSNKFIYNP